MKTFASLAAVAVLALGATPASAAISQILTPDAAYTSSTTLLSIGASDLTSITSLSDGGLTVTFAPLEARTVGSFWATWGSPPDTEGSTPRILYTLGATSVTLSFSKLLTTFGFEAEPNPFEVHSFTVDYYNGASLVGSISRSADGSAGARLFGGTGSAFDSIVVSSDTDFAMGQLRYGGGVPEPGAWALMILGFGATGAMLRSRRQALAAA